jgi:hypothetical protein
MDFAKYVQLYNAADEPRLGSLFYTDDIIFNGGNRRYEGRENFVSYLQAVSDGLRQTMAPICIVQSSDHIMAELDIEFRALTDKPEFPFGSILAGEAITLRFFGSYYLRGDRIARIHLANWAEPVSGKRAAA